VTLSLRDNLKTLEELQKVDIEMHELRLEMEKIPARQAEIDAEIAQARRAYDSEKARLEANDRERRQIETLLGMERDKVKKWEGRLGEIRTPREYAALSREIDIAKKTNETQHIQLKDLSASGAEIQKSLEAQSEVLAEREETAQAALEIIGKRSAELKERLSELQARRGDAAGQVEPSLLSKYENIKRRRAGVAVAAVLGNTCQGCNRNIPPQLGIVLQRADSIESCPYCHRIIYCADLAVPPSPAA
jgi:predicted  nucleic acid-binding Zn-ribbon protein